MWETGRGLEAGGVWMAHALRLRGLAWRKPMRAARSLTRLYPVEASRGREHRRGAPEGFGALAIHPEAEASLEIIATTRDTETAVGGGEALLSLALRSWRLAPRQGSGVRTGYVVLFPWGKGIGVWFFSFSFGSSHLIPLTHGVELISISYSS